MNRLNNKNFNPEVGDYTLLDYYAGQALSGILSNTGWEINQLPLHMVAHHVIAHEAYGIAEAMLEERNKRLNKPEGGER